MHDYSPAIRRINGLKWVSERASGPFPDSPRPRATTNRLGLAYERKVGKALAKAFPLTRKAPWHQFIDANGPGWARPDWLSLWGQYELVWECKLTYNPAAMIQLGSLYGPLRHQLSGMVVVPVVVCKNLSPQTPLDNLSESWDDLLRMDDVGSIPIVHWPGTGQFPVKPPATAGIG